MFRSFAHYRKENIMAGTFNYKNRRQITLARPVEDYPQALEPIVAIRVVYKTNH